MKETKMGPVKSSLKAYLDAKSKPNRLIGDLERHLQKRPVGDRSTTVLHPSEIIKTDFCERASWFLLSGTKKVAEKPNLRLQSIFDEGHAIHAKWQKWFQEMGILHGKFKCEVCDHITWGTSPSECEVCQAPVSKLIYDEVTLFDDALRIKGHTDGWIKDKTGDALIEIKSIGPGTLRNEAPSLMAEADGDFMKAWKLVRKPFGPHILQGQVYMELMHRMGNPVEEIVFLYELKADQDYKEFVVKRNPDLIEHIFAKAERIVKAVENKLEPKCNNNPGGTCKQCQPYEVEDEDVIA
jgi:hypothetical protein